jgi:hypothetical protein
MHIHHGTTCEKVSGDNPSVGHDHREIHVHLGQCRESVLNAKSEFEGGCLDRRRRELTAATAPFSGPSHHENNLVAGRHNSPKRRDRRLRCAQKGEAH